VIFRHATKLGNKINRFPCLIIPPTQKRYEIFSYTLGGGGEGEYSYSYSVPSRLFDNVYLRVRFIVY